MRLSLLGLIAIALCCAGPAMADSNLHIGTGTGTPCQSGCAGDPNLIGTGGTFDIAEVSNGKNAGIASLTLILAVPNDSTNALSIMVNGVTGTPKGFDTSADIYTFLFGSTSLNNSNNFSNLVPADLAHDGITATGYGLYEFSVGSILPGGFVELTSSGIPLGTFAFAEGVNGGGKLDGDAFTEAGLTTTGVVTPEPSSLMLLASGLLGLGGLVRRKLIS